MQPLPKYKFLDPRTSAQADEEPILDSVNIPLSELQNRVYELPKPSLPVLVAAHGELLESCLSVLAKIRRQGIGVESYVFGVCSKGRLWEPNGFLQEVLPILSGHRALDLACGSGREAVYLASAGWQVTGVDILPDAIAQASRLACDYGSGKQVKFVSNDVNQMEEFDPFDLVTVFFFLNRPLLKRVARALKPGASLVIETFIGENKLAFGRPKSPNLVLESRELLKLLPEMKVRSYEEGLHEERFTARYWGEKVT